MKALVFRDRDRLSYEDLPQPQLEPGEILLKVAAVGVSPLDLRQMKTPQSDEALVFGSEIAGTVAEVAAGVQGWQVGQRVATMARIPCMRCAACLDDRFSACPTYQATTTSAGLTSSGGGFAEFVKVPAHLVQNGGLIALPGHITFDRACFLQPVNAVLHGLAKLNLQPGQLLWVMGAGSLGAIAVLLATRLGLRAIVSDLNPQRRDNTVALGAEAAFDSRGEDLHTKIRAFTDGEGVDATLVTQPQGWDLMHALDGTRAGGKLLCLTDYSDDLPVPLDPLSFARREVTLMGCSGLSFRQQPRTLAYVFQHRFPLEAIVSDRVSLAELPQVLERIRTPGNASQKILAYP